MNISTYEGMLYSILISVLQNECGWVESSSLWSKRGFWINDQIVDSRTIIQILESLYNIGFGFGLPFNLK